MQTHREMRPYSHSIYSGTYRTTYICICIYLYIYIYVCMYVCEVLLLMKDAFDRKAPRMKCTGDFLKDSYAERNMRFGIREFGMGAVSNALSLDKTGVSTAPESFGEAKHELLAAAAANVSNGFRMGFQMGFQEIRLISAPVRYHPLLRHVHHLHGLHARRHSHRGAFTGRHDLCDDPRLHRRNPAGGYRML